VCLIVGVFTLYNVALLASGTLTLVTDMRKGTTLRDYFFGNGNATKAHNSETEGAPDI